MLFFNPFFLTFNNNVFFFLLYSLFVFGKQMVHFLLRYYNSLIYEKKIKYDSNVSNIKLLHMV